MSNQWFDWEGLDEEDTEWICVSMCFFDLDTFFDTFFDWDDLEKKEDCRRKEDARQDGGQRLGLINRGRALTIRGW